MGSCRCKMCGGHIHYADTVSIATCEFCGTEQTIVKTDDAKKLSLFNRANALRMQNEFDKAQLTYDNILIDDPKNAEAHWGICLCRYGIEYISVGNKKVPTCHRTIIKSIFEDLDYKETIENADVVAKLVYEKEAKEFDRLQKDILKISQQEEPYDIFISYKENDESNSRTKDSMMGEIIYNALTSKGYRVFYSKIVLKDKEPKDYEPIIFAALKSSRIMLPIGSKKEYFESSWEKNEWSRFLSFMQDDTNKYLIPCYFDMEQYDMPDEFLVFEAIDLNDPNYLGIINYRIEKLFNKAVNKIETAKVSYNQNPNSYINNLLERVKFCLTERDFAKADELIENILNTNYKCAEAYFYKVFTRLRYSDINELIKNKVNLENQKEYKTALSFADEEYKQKLININESIRLEIIRNNKEALYNRFDFFYRAMAFDKAIEIANRIRGYKDVDDKLARLQEKCYVMAKDYEKSGHNLEAIELYELIADYKDSTDRLRKCRILKHDNEEKVRIAYLLRAMDEVITRVKEKRHYRDDARLFENSLNELKYTVRDKPGWIEKLTYYDEWLNKTKRAKTKEETNYIRESRMETLFKICMPILVFAYLAFLIVPLVYYCIKLDEKMAGTWAGIDLIVVLLTIIIGAIVVKIRG